MRLAAAVAERTEPRSHLGTLASRARDASLFLKAMAHPNRLMILCILCEGERSVSELEQLLARLREDGLVKTRRQGKTIYYSLAGNDVRIIVESVDRVFGGHR